MKIIIGKENKEAEKLLPHNYQDKSGIGVHYTDEYLKQFNIKTDDGHEIKAKRKGLKISIKIDSEVGNGLMRLEEYGPEPTFLLQKALCEAAEEIGFKFTNEDGFICFERD